MIDIHNHIIPGIDDGAVDISMALEMLGMAESQGITHLVCTPHMHPGRFDNDGGSIALAFARLQEAVCQTRLSIQLAMAAEVRMTDELIVQLAQDKVPFVGRWQGRPALLLEMPHSRIPTGIEKLLVWLQQQNIQPVIAHPERNKEIMSTPPVRYGIGGKWGLDAADGRSHYG